MKTKSIWIAVVSCLVVLLLLGGCDSGREYYDDICIHLETQQAQIIIREWSYLLGSGAEVYYKNGGREVLLGNLLGGDDGFCPFLEGLYTVEEDDGKLTVEWCRFPGNQTEPWESKTFELPSD